MDTQHDTTAVPDLSVLMNSQPHDESKKDSTTNAGGNSKSRLVTGSLILLLLFFGFTSAILIWQTRQKESVTQTDTQAEEPPEEIKERTCKRFAIYKDGVAVTDFNTLKAGDTVTLATPMGNATKARFTINKTEKESTKVTFNNEFIVEYTFPLDMTDVLIKVERKINGVWQ